MSSNAISTEAPIASANPSRSISPAKVFAFLAILIFLAEVIAMGILYELHVPSYFVNSLLDATMMLVMIFPGLYYLQLKPILKEIEERKQTELALRTSEAHLKKVMEALPVGVWIIDPQGDIIHGNAASQDIWAGIHYVSINGYGEYKGWWADTGARIKPDEWAAARAIARGESFIDEEINIEAFDGTQKIILNSAVPILDEDNTILGAVVVNQDITRRRQMEKEFIRTSELQKRYFNSVHTLIAFLDREFNFIRVNEAYARSGGHPIDYFTGKNHFELYPHPENQAIFRQVVDTGQPYTVLEKPFEYPEYPERGVTYWDWSLQPVMGEDGQVEGLVFSLLEVTERKRSQLQLARQNQELLALSDAEHRLRELAESLVQAVIALNASLELDQVLCSILKQIRKAIPYEGADIILVDGDTYRPAAFLGFEAFPAVCIEVDKSYTFDGYPLLQHVCSAQQMLILGAVDEQPGWRSNPELAWVRSYAAVPLINSGKASGIIELYSEQYAAFGQDTADLLAAFAAPAAIALDNARLYQAESEARQTTETFSAAAQALSQTLDLEQVIHTLLDHISVIVNCDTAGVTLTEGEGRWALRALRGYNTWAGRDDIPTFPLGELIGSVIQRIEITRKSLVLPNLASGAGQANGSGTAPVESWVILPIIASDKVIGFVELGKSGKEMFQPKQTQWAEALVLQASVAIQNAWLFEQVRSSSERLQSLARKLVELQESERYHIARELHDEAGQSLSSLKLSLGRLAQDAACPEPIRQRLVDLIHVADGVLENLHRLAMDLRPAALDHLGLVAALKQLADRLDAERLSVQFKAVGFEGERLPQDVETSLYRIVQEALTNVLRHARASNVGILLEREGGRVKLFVEDDGIGFSPDQADLTNRLGLVGMRERAEMFGGSLSIESSSKSGTSIIVEVPDAYSYSHHR